ncbi:MAG TPA: DUF2059 domain-containing protein [Novosphingobium capsulatum]|nr:DUF2059 domain-containing protein [Novosphingobium capsulatum]
MHWRLTGGVFIAQTLPRRSGVLPEPADEEQMRATTNRLMLVGAMFAMAASSPALALTSPDPAPAPSPPPAAAPLNPADMQVARDIIAIAMPPEQRVAMIQGFSNTLLGAMSANIRSQIAVDDPGLNHIIDTMLAQVPERMKLVYERNLPVLAETMARAYVRHFSSEDLHAILAFARTPAGQHYLSRSLTVAQDPEIVEVYKTMNRDGMILGQNLSRDYAGEISAYLKAHPDVAEKIAAAHGQKAGTPPPQHKPD